jgi:two-component system, LytTR family, sensor kinase
LSIRIMTRILSIFITTMKTKQLIVKRSALIHVIVWAVIFSLPYIFSPPDARTNPEQNAFRGFATSATIMWMALFYLNANTVVPKFLYRKKYGLYLLLVMFLYSITFFLFPFLFSLWLGDKVPFDQPSAARWTITPFIFMILVSTTYRTIYDRIKADTIADEKQKENLKTELSFLRSQISPHFLFNVLNNIVSLVRMKSDELESTILKLSSLMQYMLYNTDEEKVQLSDEVQYLQSYIDLQQQRFGSKVKLNSSLNVSDSAAEIEPMLLIPFVENAFKHGIGLIKNPEINIELYADENLLHFLVDNKFNAANVAKDKTSGIGLANVQRRLELLHGKDYMLDIKKNSNIYSVSLQIKLK